MDRLDRKQLGVSQKIKMALAALAALHLVSSNDLAHANELSNGVVPPAASRVLTPDEQARKDKAFRDDVEQSKSVDKVFETLGKELERRKTEEKRLQEERERALQALKDTQQPDEPGPLEKNERVITRNIEIAIGISQILERALRGDISADDVKKLEELEKEQKSMKFEKMLGQE